MSHRLCCALLVAEQNVCLSSHFAGLERCDIQHRAIRCEEHVEVALEVGLLEFLVEILDVEGLARCDVRGDGIAGSLRECHVGVCGGVELFCNCSVTFLEVRDAALDEAFRRQARTSHCVPLARLQHLFLHFRSTTTVERPPLLS